MSDTANQLPVPYTVTSGTPTRIGGMVPPFSIINLENSGTVWLANNPGIIPGLGTPLYAGATLTWNVAGDFWARCDPGEQCNLLVVKDVQDWSPNPNSNATAIAGAIAAIPLSAASIGAAVPSAASIGSAVNTSLVAGTFDTDIGNAVNTALVAGTLDVEIANAMHADSETVLLNGTVNTTGTTLNVTPYPSLHLFVTFTVANQALFIETRTAAGLTIRRNVLQSGFRTAVTGPGLWRGTIPCKGERLFLKSSAGTPTVVVLGSTTPVDKISQDVMNCNQVLAGTKDDSSYMWTDRANLLTPANVLQYDCYPWIGSLQADISFVSTAAMVNSYARWVINQSVGTMAVRYDAFAADPETNGFGVTTTLAVNGDAPRLEIANNTAVNWTSFNVTITPTNGVGL